LLKEKFTSAAPNGSGSRPFSISGQEVHDSFCPTISPFGSLKTQFDFWTSISSRSRPGTETRDVSPSFSVSRVDPGSVLFCQTFPLCSGAGIVPEICLRGKGIVNTGRDPFEDSRSPEYQLLGIPSTGWRVRDLKEFRHTGQMCKTFSSSIVDPILLQLDPEQ
jgi:hypothetical protein